MTASIIDPSADLVLAITARWMTFAFDLALSGDLTHALDQAEAGPSADEADPTAVENLFWD